MASVNYEKDIGMAKVISNEFQVMDGMIVTVDPAHVSLFKGETELIDGTYSFPRKLKIGKKQIVDIDNGIMTIDNFEKVKIAAQNPDKISNPKYPNGIKYAAWCFGASVKEIMDFLKVAKKYSDVVKVTYQIGKLTFSYPDPTDEKENNWIDKVIKTNISSGFPSVSLFPLDYLMMIFKQIDKVDDTVDISLNVDNPILIKGKGYEYILAPRIESD